MQSYCIWSIILVSTAAYREGSLPYAQNSIHPVASFDSIVKTESGQAVNIVGGANSYNPFVTLKSSYTAQPVGQTPISLSISPLMPIHTLPPRRVVDASSAAPPRVILQELATPATIKTSYAINFCNPEEFPSETLAQYGLQRVSTFIWNSSCSEIFFQCSFGETYLLKCPSPAQAFDKNITNCNFKRNMPECPEYDQVLHCAIAKHCSEDEFACCAMPQRCIPLKRRCDGHLDCADGGDESNCPSCGIAQFACVKSGRCIEASQRCDGVIDDCADGSNIDELGCTRNSTCVGKFVCESDLSKTIMGVLNCIDPSLRCNGVKDCPNGEDETNCKRGETQHLLCENQKESITLKQWCDGQKHCSDGSDEKYCK